MPNDILHDVKSAAARLNISVRGVYRMPESLLPRIRLGGLVRFRDSDLEKLIERCSSEHAREPEATN